MADRLSEDELRLKQAKLLQNASQDSGDPLSGAMSGASAGSSFGPKGAMIGGAVGLVKGIMQAKQKRRQKRANIETERIAKVQQAEESKEERKRSALQGLSGALTATLARR